MRLPNRLLRMKEQMKSLFQRGDRKDIASTSTEPTAQPSPRTIESNPRSDPKNAGHNTKHTLQTVSDSHGPLPVAHQTKHNQPEQSIANELKDFATTPRKASLHPSDNHGEGSYLAPQNNKANPAADSGDFDTRDHPNESATPQNGNVRKSVIRRKSVGAAEKGGEAAKAANGEDDALATDLNGLDLTDKIDVDRVTLYAPAVTQESVRPTVHEVAQQQISREIHTHDVFHRIQPIYDLEVLPARHYVPGPEGTLIEVSGNELPGCTGSNQNWHIVHSTSNQPNVYSRDPPELTRVKNSVEKHYTTEDGIERRERTIVHPLSLEDMSTFTGPVLPIHFDEHGVGHEMSLRQGGLEATT